MVVSTPAIARTGPIDRMYGGPEIINRHQVPLPIHSTCPPIMIRIISD